MKIDEKSIAYAFIANGIQIYLGENYFLASRLVCLKCGEYWYMNLTECFLCGAKNPHLFQCISCGSFQSITKSNQKCNNCDSSDDLFMVCPNPECISNNNDNIKEKANTYGGALNKDSGLSISQQYCLNCGSKYHWYKSYKIYVRCVPNRKVKFEDLNITPDSLSDSSYLLIKYKQNEKSIEYGLYKIREIVGKAFELNSLEDSFAEIVSELFPVVSIREK